MSCHLPEEMLVDLVSERLQVSNRLMARYESLFLVSWLFSANNFHTGRKFPRHFLFNGKKQFFSSLF